MDSFSRSFTYIAFLTNNMIIYIIDIPEISLYMYSNCILPVTIMNLCCPIYPYFVWNLLTNSSIFYTIFVPNILYNWGDELYCISLILYISSSIVK